MKNYKKIIIFHILVAIFFTFVAKDVVSAEELSNKTTAETYKSTSEESLEKHEQKEKPKEKPLAVIEWDNVWLELWDNEAKMLKQKGVTEKEIIIKLDPVAASRVASKLKMDKVEVKKIVDAYYSAYYAAEEAKQAKSESK